ncbi:ADP-ribose pyrophosphatase YjhB (NUDIX family) [Paenibacillus taihuensis]|uniref:ADP-ribose pyrophosphatase YjhB (NUDIX family) n=1 Tax=Paenibacillus taihuensis TaxID=1156355 RepID=A0A3D9RYZ2_9BACL|nr:NUDIX hydrolase [Paenibacillus taihuensis]REE85285.1 ADP-ribose pyrophosphatase YjhB (NUDIX family) [Paenibacillus taihuensis]
MADDSGKFHRHMGVYGVCVTTDSRLLVIRKILGPYTGRYDLPGGRLEPLEALEQGITREIREETGHTVRSLRNIGVCDFSVMWSLHDETVEHLHHIAILYDAAIDIEEVVSIVESFEGQDSNGAIWLSFDEVTSANSSPLVIQAIEWIRAGTLPIARGFFDYRSS